MDSSITESKTENLPQLMLLQDNHLLCSSEHISLESIEVCATGYSFTSISLTIPIDSF